jgi:MFS family permease
VGTDGAPVIRRWHPAGPPVPRASWSDAPTSGTPSGNGSPAAGRAGASPSTGRAAPEAQQAATSRPAATDVVDDDATPPTGIPVAGPPLRPWSPRQSAYDPDLHRPPPRWGQPEPPAPEPVPEPEPEPEASPKRVPRKMTVTRVAALRSREITENGWRAFHRAATADGADRSGLTALTYATMMTYAVDAAVAVALANTLFFAAATAESRTNVALYLAITVAPFALVAPVIGPFLDRLQRGRRTALAVSFGGRAVLAVVMAFGYDSWVLYPAALGAMVLSKSFVVLKAAVTPRVLPETITLVTTNSRLTTFGLASGALFGGIAAGIAAVWGSPGALFFTAALGVAGVLLCLRIPAWVEVTEGEVPATLHESEDSPPRSTPMGRTPMGRTVLVALWGNAAARVLTGFLTLFVAFVVKAQTETETEPTRQLLLIAVVGAAAGLGSFAGNAIGARQRFDHSDALVLAAVGIAATAAAFAAFLPGIGTAAITALVAATCSALAKVALDAVVQRELPERSRASAFGRSETVLQLAWVFGGALGVLLPHDTFRLGFGVVAGVMALAGTQAVLVSRGRTLLPLPRRHPTPPA